MALPLAGLMLGIQPWAMFLYMLHEHQNHLGAREKDQCLLFPQPPLNLNLQVGSHNLALSSFPGDSLISEDGRLQGLDHSDASVGVGVFLVI